MTITTAPARPAPSPGVDARPFRAHVELLLASGRLSVAELAERVGVSEGALRHLLRRRPSRAAPLIGEGLARRLLAVSVRDVRAPRP